MLRNYFVTALRNITRHKLYSFINIAGLTIALTCTILIVLFVRDELSWDRWLPGSGGLYRLSTTLNYPNRDPQHFAITSFPLLPAVKDAIPEIVGATHIVPEDVTIGVGQNQFYETADAVDPSFFQVIRLPFAEGSPEQVFAQSESVALSQSTARKYFGPSDPIGRIITVSGTVCPAPRSGCQTYVRPLTVRGVFLDPPHNSQLDVKILFPTTSAADEMTERAKGNWLFLSGFSYVLLAPGSNANEVAGKINRVIDRSFDVRKIAGLNMRASDFERVRLTQFWDVHLSTEKFSFDMRPAGHADTVYGIAAMAGLILLIASFNYTNLAVAQAVLRAKEIALRKCVGARRWQIALQFLGESVTLAGISLILALSVVETILPSYSRLLARPLEFRYLEDWRLLLMLAALTVLLGLLSGAYPAFILSRIKPAVCLRSNKFQGDKASSFRTGLLALQFAVSIGLGTVTIAIFSQNEYERKLDLGFHHDNVLVVDSGSGLPANSRSSFAETLASLPAVEKVAISTTGPFANAVIANTHVHVPGSAQDFVVIPMTASPEYPQLYQMRLLAGRFLSPRYASDRFSGSGNGINNGRNIVINETAARYFGFGLDQAVGKSIVLADSSRVTIVGVLGNAQVEGASRAVAPTIYFNSPETGSAISIKIHRGQALEAVKSIAKTWKAFAPQSAIQMRFLNQDFQALFDDLERRGLIFGIFSLVAILIACLGLFGIAAFSVERRTKEVGVRKVFGAEAVDIMYLLMGQFSAPLVFASLIAWPATYVYLRQWLEQYPNKISLNPLYFLSASLIALLISAGTVFFHARHASKASPIHALRYE